MREDIYYVGSPSGDTPFRICIAGISYCDGSYRIRRTDSDVMSIEYIYDGSGTVEYGGHTYHPEKDDVYMVLQGRDQVYYSDEKTPWKKIWFNASGVLINALTDAYGLTDACLFRATGAAKYFERMLELCASGLPADTINDKGAVIFHELLTFLKNSGGEPDAGIVPDAVRMKEYIDAHLSEEVSIDQLAALIYKSPSQASRIFRQTFGRTPYGYLTHQRFSLAKIMLLGTNMLVKEIAYSVGFRDEHYFSYVFGKKFGETPSAFRGGK